MPYSRKQQETPEAVHSPGAEKPRNGVVHQPPVYGVGVADGPVIQLKKKEEEDLKKKKPLQRKVKEEEDLKKKKPIQRKAQSGDSSILIDAPDSPLEKEADAVAEQVVRRMSAPGSADMEPIRAPAGHISRAAAGGDAGVMHAPAYVASELEASRGQGQALPEPTQSFMSQAFGTDLSDVRVHTGVEAGALNDALHARAFTVGHDIYFKENEYDSVTSSGINLLAHEITHLLQQRKLGNISIQKQDDELKQTYTFSDMLKWPLKILIDTEIGDDESPYLDQLSNRNDIVRADAKCNVTVLSLQLVNILGSEDAVRRFLLKYIREIIGFPGYEDTYNKEYFEWKGKKAIARTSEVKKPLPDVLLNAIEIAEMSKRISPGESLVHQTYAKLKEFVDKMMTEMGEKGITATVGGYENKQTYLLKSGNDAFWKDEDSAKAAFKSLPRMSMMGTKLTGGHIVLFVQYKEDGIIINDPYGMNLGKQGKYIPNGQNMTWSQIGQLFNDILDKDNVSRIDVINNRIKYNNYLQGILSEMQKQVPRFPPGAGDLNFFSWGEVQRLKMKTIEDGLMVSAKKHMELPDGGLRVQCEINSNTATEAIVYEKSKDGVFLTFEDESIWIDGKITYKPGDIIPELNKARFAILKKRMMKKKDVCSLLDKSDAKEAFPRNLGELNFYKWSEVVEFRMGINTLSITKTK